MSWGRWRCTAKWKREASLARRETGKQAALAHYEAAREAIGLLQSRLEAIEGFVAAQTTAGARGGAAAIVTAAVRGHKARKVVAQRKKAAAVVAACHACG